MGSRSAKRGVGEEYSHLRRRCAELEDQLRKLGTSDGDAQRSLSRQPSFEDALKSRTVQPFKINDWDNERKGSNVNSMSEPETPGARGLEIVPLENAQSPTSNGQEGSIVPAANDSNSVVSARRRWCDTWVPQPRLQVGDCCEDPSCDSLLSGMRSELLTARFDNLLTKMDGVFEEHLQNFQLPHLRFSAALVSLYSILREGGMVSLADSHSSLTFDDVDDDCLSRCANLARHFVSKARFNDKPPARQPAEIARVTYVGELCTQAGLSLDLFRFGVVHQRRVKDRSNSSNQPSQDTEDIAAPSSPKGRRPKEPEVCVGPQERLSHFERAGCYLAAVQMDMDRYRDEFEGQREAMLKSRARASAIELLSIDIEHPLQALGDATPGTPESILNLESSPKSDKALLLAREMQSSAAKKEQLGQVDLQQKTRGQEASQTQSSLAIAESVSSAKENLTDMSFDSNASNMNNREGICARDPLLIPSFGEFLEKQVFPLYVADLSFRKLKTLAENYCGITLDSDDERAAWKDIGLTKPVKHRRETRAPLASNETCSRLATPAPSESDGTKLTELCELIGKSKSKAVAPVMRAQMQTSIVEKRTRGFRAFRDYESTLQSQSKVAPLASPQIKTARVLYEGSTPLSAAFASQRAVYPECSPLSMRKTSRGRLELQASSRSTRSENRSRTPRTGGERQPDWEAM